MKRPETATADSGLFMYNLALAAISLAGSLNTPELHEDGLQPF